MSALVLQIESANMNNPELFEPLKKKRSPAPKHVFRHVGTFEGNTQPPIERPSDVLVPQLSLDGAPVHPDPA